MNRKKQSNKKKVIVDFKKLNDEILSLLVEKFPDGYGDQDVIVFKNVKGETIEAVEVETEDTIYLVKISQRLEIVMEEFDDDEDDDYSYEDQPSFEEPEADLDDLED
ncbi:Uncharacterised protein [Candidatus Ornithobacterium hominis]|uniref:hypothetical protein n=1 Tax=Candidatus Ornithobacterium hominis TaxID=2497989 RepID=UPI000E5ADFFB|nr:hypothetical protein [Candidatus Ornithobacterium hominis]SZD72582.1 Uncharacterised protein [Candidatus Ornithobacterium hominis]